MPVAAEIDRLADMYHLRDGERETMHLLADAARKRESSARVADFAQTYVTLERASKEIDYYDAELILASAQTEDYARAVLETSASGQVDERLSDRVARGAILTRPKAPTVRILLGEASLHRLVGGPEVLRDQLKHLLEIGKLSNVSVRVLPFAVGAHRAMGVGFSILRLGAPSLRRVYTEGLTNATYIHESGEVDTYEHGFRDIWALAADERRSVTILRRRIEQIE